jgi:predicted DNA-binding protein
MATQKQQFKIRLEPELVARLHALHSSYGEAGRKVQELVRDYVEREERRRGKTTTV